MSGELNILCFIFWISCYGLAEGRIYGPIRLYLLFLFSRSVTAISCLEKKEEKRMMTATVDFYSAFRISTEVVNLQRCLTVTWLVPRETAAVSARSVYAIQPSTMSRHFMHKPHT